jgi:hypothetical protein
MGGDQGSVAQLASQLERGLALGREESGEGVEVDLSPLQQLLELCGQQVRVCLCACLHLMCLSSLACMYNQRTFIGLRLWCAAWRCPSAIHGRASQSSCGPWVSDVSKGFCESIMHICINKACNPSIGVHDVAKYLIHTEHHFCCRNVVKIGEGTFGEAFKAGKVVLKIVPMDGGVLVSSACMMWTCMLEVIRHPLPIMTSADASAGQWRAAEAGC